MDMTDPTNPQPLSFKALSDNPTDVVLKGNTAIVGYSSDTAEMFDLSDPTNPQSQGKIVGIGGKLFIYNFNQLFSTGIIIGSPGSPISGIHSTDFEPVCTTLRSQLAKNPPLNANSKVSYPLQSLDWTIASGTFSAQDGFVLNAVQLGSRLMANKMSLPYLIIQRDPAGSVAQKLPGSLHCSLSPNSSPACAESQTSRSQLFAFNYYPSDGDRFILQAEYLLDRLDGDHDQDSTKADSCVLVTQHYEFWREGYDAPEASDELSAARFKPIVSYQYYSDTGPAFKSPNTAQRFQFEPTAFQFNSTTTPPTFTYPASSSEIGTFFKDCDASDFVFHLFCFVDYSGGHVDAGVITPDGNPIPNEITVRVVQDGQQPGHFVPFSTTGDPRSPLDRADNLHLRSFAGATTDIAGPTPSGHPGCPECVHIHWRWGSVLTRSNPIGALIVSPRFDNNGGNPMIPTSSNQDVDLGVVVAEIGGGNGTEEHPSPGQTDLDFASSNSINSQEPLSFWYSATGHSTQDTFM